MKMTSVRILLGLCCAFALIFSTVNCEGSVENTNYENEMSNTENEASAEKDDDPGCAGFRETVDSLNQTCQFIDKSEIEDNKKNISMDINIIYKAINSIECSFCKLKDDPYFATEYNACSKAEDAKNRPYAKQFLCGLEALTCTFEKLCETCPKYFRELKVDCKKESKM